MILLLIFIGWEVYAVSLRLVFLSSLILVSNVRCLDFTIMGIFRHSVTNTLTLCFCVLYVRITCSYFNWIYHLITLHINLHYRVPLILVSYNFSWQVTSLNGHLHLSVTIWSSKCIFCINDLQWLVITVLMILGVLLHAHAITRLKQSWGFWKHTPCTMYRYKGNT